MPTIRIDPVTRIEGHLDIEATVETVNGVQQAVDARCAGTSFRGFETILARRDPRDAVHYTQRICGVCPTSHAMASCLALEAALAVAPPDNGRILRNLVLAADHIQSHVLHLYHLALPDYVDTGGILDGPPWTPRQQSPDLIGGAAAQGLMKHYVAALAIRRKAHQMGAIFGAKLPCTATFVVGGNTETVTAEKISAFRALLTEIREFIDQVMIPDTNMLGERFPEYYHLGRGPGNLLSFGVFDLDATGQSKLLARGRVVGGATATVDVGAIAEYARHSWLTEASGHRNPAHGLCEPLVDKPGAYSWIKAPRYLDGVYEAGPLARLYVNGDYRRGISVMDRLMARSLETKKVADAMADWLGQLQAGKATLNEKDVPTSGAGIGLTEAPRGALGHWVTIEEGKIARYQVVTPTAWNASPRDDAGVPGALEQALVGTPVADREHPIELLRVVHSFDPCLACAVHVVRPNSSAR